MFVNGLSNFVFPRSANAFSNGGEAALRRVLWKTGIVYLTALGAFCLFIVAFGQPLMIFLYDGKYTETSAILTVLAISVLATSLGNTVGNGLWAIHWPQANFAADLCVTAATFVTVYILILSAWRARCGRLQRSSAQIAGTSVRLFTLHRKLTEIQHPA